MVTQVLMRARAEQYREMAAEAADPMLKAALIDLALAYEHLAEQLARQEPDG